MASAYGSAGSSAATSTASTRQPCVRQRRTVAAPMPRAAPVTSATRLMPAPVRRARRRSARSSVVQQRARPYPASPAPGRVAEHARWGHRAHPAGPQQRQHLARADARRRARRGRSGRRPGRRASSSDGLGAAGVRVAVPARLEHARRPGDSARSRATARATGCGVAAVGGDEQQPRRTSPSPTGPAPAAAARAPPGRSTACRRTRRARRWSRRPPAGATSTSVARGRQPIAQRDRDVGVGRQRQVRAVLLGRARAARPDRAPPRGDVRPGEVRELAPSAPEPGERVLVARALRRAAHARW